jgi:uncharacterized repeat protein (TIGR01451 family)
LLATGDFNGDGATDVADYVVWRDTLGVIVEAFTGADADGNGRVEEADYGLWKANFGSREPVADLELLSITDNPDPVAAGQSVTYVVTVANRGPGTASGIRLNFAAGIGLSINSITTSVPGATSSIDAGGAAGQVVLGTPLPADLTFTAEVVAITSEAGHDMAFEAPFSAFVTSLGSDDQNSSNDMKQVTTTITPAVADLEILPIGDDPDPVRVGQLVTYTVTVVNNGPSPAEDVTVTFVPGGGLVIVSIVTPQGSSSVAEGRASLGNTPYNSAVTISVIASTNNAGGNTDFETPFFAFATSLTIDSHPLNDLQSESTTILVPTHGTGAALGNNLPGDRSGNQGIVVVQRQAGADDSQFALHGENRNYQVELLAATRIKALDRTYMAMSRQPPLYSSPSVSLGREERKFEDASRIGDKFAVLEAAEWFVRACSADLG